MRKDIILNEKDKDIVLNIIMKAFCLCVNDLMFADDYEDEERTPEAIEQIINEYIDETLEKTCNYTEERLYTYLQKYFSK